MTEPSKEAVEKWTDDMMLWRFGKGWRRTLSPGEIEGYRSHARSNVLRTYEQTLPIERERWEKEAREAFDNDDFRIASRQPALECNDAEEIATRVHAVIVSTLDALFEKRDPESLSERVEWLEAELVEVEAAVEAKRQEDGP
jgi:hypothetical protein